MKLSQIVFPVYKLRDLPPSTEDQVLFYLYRDTIKVIDDTSVEGDSLAKRRLKIDPKSLYKLKYAIFFIGDLIKQAGPNQYFIDSSGKYFNLTKNSRRPLTYKRIIEVVKNVGSTSIKVEGMDHYYTSLFPPLEDQKYAALLNIAPNSYVLYGYADQRYKNTYRKV